MLIPIRYGVIASLRELMRLEKMVEDNILMIMFEEQKARFALRIVFGKQHQMVVADELAKQKQAWCKYIHV